ncbi:universal stress protein [Alicyclobacillus mengziensis]|uniref:Universal stress protein n=1 Tax=Alicyclobacillus mengziensis TaxID=2931921 RepID=A0A9X7VX21_9BACL|nr:universal stress protein [Alicyclobacillus mengziensis]QSO46417.1 universal stress protein [Alicyclobacillus mengziensis]
MSQRFLVPIDGSVHSTKAVETAIELIQSLRQKPFVTLLHVNHTPPIIDNYDVNIDIEEVVKREGQKILRPASERLKAMGIRFEAISLKGEPVNQICALAKKGDYDMVIMGSRGLGRVSELVLGSVSRQVIQHVQCPVLITK